MSEPESKSSSEIVAEGNISVGAVSDDAWQRWRDLTTDAYARFHVTLRSNRALFPSLTSYDPMDRARATSGTWAWSWGAAGEIQETINSINAWGVRLHEWGAWNLVLDSYETDDDKWDVLNHFVEPTAFFCMLQPSSLADRLMVASETLLHQANRRVFPDEPDRLDQDSLPPGRILRRSDRRKQLNRLGKPWAKFHAFGTALDAMNGPDYQKVTRNYRDLSSHSFAPRLMLGQVVRAIRSIVPWQEMVKQPDGSFLPVDHPTRKGVQYAMQSLGPLPLDATRSANLAEYEKALVAMRAFAALIDELCDCTDALPEREAQSEHP